jgi:aminopeptidase YwaD
MDHCFALWGGEEIGLVGSRHFVEQLTPEARDQLEAYFNLDVVASEGTPELLGSSDLIAEAETLAAEIDIEVASGVLPDGVSSDHVPFLDGGISALMVTTPNFARIHTPEDTIANLDATYLQPIADLGFALLRAHTTP